MCCSNPWSGRPSAVGETVSRRRDPSTLTIDRRSMVLSMPSRCSVHQRHRYPLASPRWSPFQMPEYWTGAGSDFTICYAHEYVMIIFLLADGYVCFYSGQYDFLNNLTIPELKFGHPSLSQTVNVGWFYTTAGHQVIGLFLMSHKCVSQYI